MSGPLPPGHASVSDRVTRLLTRFERTGRRADLDEAVSIARAASVHDVGAERPRLLSLLGSALRMRFLYTGASEDLDEAIDLEREAVASVADEPIRTARYCGNLALSLRERFLRHRDPDDLDAAVRYAEDAVRSGAEAGPLDRAGWSSNLAAVLGTRYELTGELVDLDRAVDATRRAVADTPEGHPDRAGQLTNLAMALIGRYDRTRAAADLREGTDVAWQAVEASPADSPARAVQLYNMGVALWEQDGATGSTTSAAKFFRESAQTRSAVPLLRARAAEAWANVAARAGDWQQASVAWDQVFDILPILIDEGIGRSDRQHHLSLLAGAGPDAAAVELSLGHVRRAWQRLEQGRGVLLGQALRAHDRRAGLEPTRAGPPASTVELPELPVHGPVVALNVSSWRCDALILRNAGDGHTEMEQLRLGTLTYSETVDRVNAFLAAVHAPDRGPRNVLDEILGWLWDVAVEPVLDHLGHQRPPESGRPWPRIWWMPTGPLCLLPVHAAGHHRDPDDGRRALDRVVSSYTPTLRALRPEVSRHDSRADRRLVVAIDRAPGLAPLHHAEAEARTVAQVPGLSTSTLLGAAATRKAVTTLLPSVRDAHFATHAVAHEDPSESHLVLADGVLGVSQIGSSDLHAGELVYLSTCTSAYGGTALLDESLHIASAFQLAGFRHAVATLWPLDDRIAPKIAEQFYRRLAEGAGPAHALHDAVRMVRGRRSPVLWASHVHVGP
jgi:CHAT domain